MAEPDEHRHIALLVTELLRRASGKPTMTDAEFDDLVQECLDDPEPGTEPTDLSSEEG